MEFRYPYSLPYHWRLRVINGLNSPFGVNWWCRRNTSLICIWWTPQGREEERRREGTREGAQIKSKERKNAGTYSYENKTGKETQNKNCNENEEKNCNKYGIARQSEGKRTLWKMERKWNLNAKQRGRKKQVMEQQREGKRVEANKKGIGEGKFRQGEKEDTYARIK